MVPAEEVRSGTVVSMFRLSDKTELYYKDWGKGRAVVFSHGWPLNADAWDEQLMFLASRGYRAIAHDRRGHGRSSQAWKQRHEHLCGRFTRARPTATHQEQFNADLLAFIKS